MKSLMYFVQYHNAIPIALGILFLGAGATFAATNPQAIYSQSERIVTVDNTYIAHKDLSTYTPSVGITSVTEDAENYYVSYTFSTIDVVDSVWRDVTKDRQLTVSKQTLAGADLGLYVTEQLSQLLDHEKDRLHESQAAEQHKVSTKQVATTYGGLVGKFLDEKTETLPGYAPVVVDTPPTGAFSAGVPGAPGGPAVMTAVAAVAGSTLTREEVESMISARVAALLAQGQAGPPASSSSGSVVSADNGTANPPPSPLSTGDPVSDTQAPIITVSGNNPATVEVGSTYVDLGASVTDNVDNNLGIKASVDGGAEIELGAITIDTSAAGTHTIEYRATDQAGNTGTATRTVTVESISFAGPGEASPPPVISSPTTEQVPEATSSTDSSATTSSS